MVEKEAVPVERVRLGKTTVTEHATVSEGLRKEEIEVDGVHDTAAGRTTGTAGTARDDRGLMDKAKDALDRDNDGRIGR